MLLVSIAAGLFFFAWPIRMNQSGLPLTSVVFVYAGVSFVAALIGMLIVPGAWLDLQGRPLLVGMQAAIFNLLGMLAFSYVLTHAATAEAPRYILIVITLQTALTGAWAAYQSGTFQPRLLIGLATALATVLLLQR